MSNEKNSPKGTKNQGPAASRPRNSAVDDKRIHELSSRVDNLEKLDRALVGEILKADLPKLASEVPRLANEVAELKGASPQFASAINQLSEAVSTLAGHVDDQGRALNRVSTRQDAQDQAIAGMGARLGRLLVQLGQQIASEAEATRTSTRSAVTTSSKMVTKRMENRFNQVDTALSDISSRVGRLQSNLDEYIDVIKKLDPIVDQYSQDINDLKGAIHQNGADLQSTNELIVGAFGLFQGKMDEKFNALPGSIKTVVSNLIDNKFKDLHAKVTKLAGLGEKNFATVEKLISAADGAPTAIIEAINTLRGASAGVKSLLVNAVAQASGEIFNAAEGCIQQHISGIEKKFNDINILATVGTLQKATDDLGESARVFVGFRNDINELESKIVEVFNANRELFENAGINITVLKNELIGIFSGLHADVKQIEAPVSKIRENVEKTYETSVNISTQLAMAMATTISSEIRDKFVRELNPERIAEDVARLVAPMVFEMLTESVNLP